MCFTQEHFKASGMMACHAALINRTQCNSASWLLRSGTCFTPQCLEPPAVPLVGSCPSPVPPSQRLAVARTLLYQNSSLRIALLELKTFYGVLLLLCKVGLCFLALDEAHCAVTVGVCRAAGSSTCCETCGQTLCSLTQSSSHQRILAIEVEHNMHLSPSCHPVFDADAVALKS